MTRKVTVGRRRRGGHQSTKRSRTSPRAIKMQQRRAAALDLRLQGYAYHRIGKVMGCNASTVHNMVCQAMAQMIPKEKIEHAYELEMERLDILQAAFFSDASNGDQAATDMVLKIMAHRARLMGLNADGSKQPSVHFNINGGDRPDAIEQGLKVEFVRPRWKEDPFLELEQQAAAISPNLLPRPK